MNTLKVIALLLCSLACFALVGTVLYIDQHAIQYPQFQFSAFGGFVELCFLMLTIWLGLKFLVEAEDFIRFIQKTNRKERRRMLVETARASARQRELVRRTYADMLTTSAANARIDMLEAEKEAVVMSSHDTTRCLTCEKHHHNVAECFCSSECEALFGRVAIAQRI